MKSIISKLFCRKKILFCYSLIVLSILFLIIILILKPSKSNITYIYDTGGNFKISALPKHTIQYFYPKVDNIDGIHIYFEDDSVLNCNFHVTLSDNHNNTYYDQNIIDYQSNILYLKLDNIENASDAKFQLNIDWLNCHGIKASLGKAMDKNNYLKGYEDQSLKLTVDNTSPNNNYYWYSAMAILIALLLLPLARSEE